MGKGLLDWLLEDDVFEVRFGLQRKQTSSLQSDRQADETQPADDVLSLDVIDEAPADDKPPAPSIASVQRQRKSGVGRWIGLAFALLVLAAAGLLFAPLPEPLAPFTQQLRNAIGLDAGGNTPPPAERGHDHVAAPLPMTAPATAPAAATASAPVTMSAAATATAAGATDSTAATETVSAPAPSDATSPPESGAVPAPAEAPPARVWYIEAGPFATDTPPPAIAEKGYGWTTTSDELERSGRQVVATNLTEEQAGVLLNALKEAGIAARIRKSTAGASVVAGPFDNRKDADRAAVEMAKLGAPASAADVKLRVTRYWGRIGPVADATAAEELAEQLKRQVANVAIREALERP